MGNFKKRSVGKTGKVDVIEDIIGTEELKGTYEVREQTAKLLKQDKMIREAREKKFDEMMQLRERKRKELEELAENEKKFRDINMRLTYVLYHTLEPDAYQYLDYLRRNNQDLCHKIIYCIVPPKEMRMLDAYVSEIQKHGPSKEKIKLEYIIALEKAITGRKSKIEVERDGERISIDEAIRGRKVA